MDTPRSYIGVWIALVLVLGGICFGIWKYSLPVEQSGTKTPETTATKPQETAAIDPNLPQYIEVTDSCGPYFDVSTCVSVHSGPGTSFPRVGQLRNGVVLRVSDTVVAEGHTWYKVTFDEWVRYPERVTDTWYVAADYVRHFNDPGPSDLAPGTHPQTTKRIVVNRTKEMLYAYDGDTLFMQEPISSGLELTPTPRGTFTIYRKTPSRYMQGPLPGISDQYYDLPGVPWNLYFTVDGAVIHGAYWHNHFGEPWSHGCVNLSPENAQKLYHWAELGTPVIIQD